MGDGGVEKLQQMIEEMKCETIVPVIRVRAQPSDEENRICRILARALAERLKWTSIPQFRYRPIRVLEYKVILISES